MVHEDDVTQVETKPPPPPPGELVDGDVRVGQLVGAGLSSEIYAAHNVVANKPCALKLFRTALDVGPVARGRYSHATDLAGRLGSEDIVDVYRVGRTADGRTFGLCAWAEGAALGQLLRQQGRLSRRAYLPLMHEIGQVLSIAHGQGLPHLRIHGGNLLVQKRANGTPRVRLLDFGVHHLHPPVNEPTPGNLERLPEHAICIAPEQASGALGDNRSDIYALCVLLYQMVTGRPPFVGDTFEATVEQHLSSEPPQPADLAPVSEEIASTLLRGLEKDPRKRIPSIEALLASLDPTRTTTGQHPVLARSQSPRTRTLDHADATFTPPHEPEIDASAPPPLPAAAEQPAAAAPTPIGDPDAAADADEQVDADRLRPPRRRVVLFGSLAAAVALFGGAVSWWLLSPAADGGDAPPRKKHHFRAGRRPTKPRPQPPSPPPQSPPPRPAPPQPAAKPPPPPPREEPSPPAPEPKKKAPSPSASEPHAKSTEKTVPRAGRANIAPLSRARKVEGVGTLHVSTGSARAQIFVDGHFMGLGITRVLRRVPAGKHRVHLVIDGRKTPHKDVVVTDGKRTDVVF